MTATSITMQKLPPPGWGIEAPNGLGPGLPGEAGMVATTEVVLVFDTETVPDAWFVKVSV